MSYIVLALCLVLLFVVAFFLFGNDLFAPPCLFVLIFVFVSVLSYVGTAGWNSVELGVTTSLIVIVGCACVIAGGYIVYRSFGSTQVNDYGRFITEKLQSYRLQSWKLVVALLFIAASAALKIREMRKIAGATATDFSALIKQTRYATSYYFKDSDDATASFSFAVNQSNKFVLAIGLVSAVYLIVCFKRRNDWLQKILTLSCVLGACAYSLLSGGRGSAMSILLAVLLAWGVISIRSGQSVMQSSVSLAKKCAVAALILFPLFYASSTLIGREASGGFSDYLSFYFGVGLPSLEVKIQQGGSLAPELPLYNTFYGFYGILNRFAHIKLPAYANDWVSLGDYSSYYNSNVFTCFYRYYADAGMWGVVIFSLLAGALYMALYLAALRVPSVFIIPFWLNIVRSMIDVGRDETLLSRQLTSMSTYNLSICILIVSIFFFGWLVFPKHCKELKEEFETGVPVFDQSVEGKSLISAQLHLSAEAYRKEQARRRS